MIQVRPFSLYCDVELETIPNQALNPSIHDLPILDPKDADLLLDPASSSGQYANGPSGTNGPATPLAHVPWLRKTEYISREGVMRSSNHEPYVPLFYTVLSPFKIYRKHVMSAPIDVSRAAQLRDIEASFAACNENFSLASIRHPNKPGVTAIDSYEVLPDADVWPNQYDLFRFSERPGERPVDVCFLLLCLLCQINCVPSGGRSSLGLCYSSPYEVGSRFFPSLLPHTR